MKVQIPSNRTTRNKMVEALEEAGAIESQEKRSGLPHRWSRSMHSLEELDELPEHIIPSPAEVEERILQKEISMAETKLPEHTCTAP